MLKKCFRVLSLVVVIVLLLAMIGSLNTPNSDVNFMVERFDVHQVVCYANPSVSMITEGWLRLYDVDRHRVSRLVRDGKAEIREEQSLICYDYREGKDMERSVVSEQWWRRT